MKSVFLENRAIISLLLIVTLTLAVFPSIVQAEIENPEYAGSNTCKMCHPDIWKEWYNSGHAHMLMTPEEALEVNPDLQPPPGYTWDDILYVVGGWYWKARFLNKSGYFITSHYEDGKLVPGGNQWNMWTKRWVDYHAGEVKGYTCASCHTTGYDPEAPSHMGLPGIKGDWVERNIACEACHGPAKNHTTNPLQIKPKIPSDEETCGRCHIRGDPTVIDAKGGMIRHHEQYEEWLQSPHEEAGVSCTTCHDPHESTVYNEEEALKVSCEDCHTSQAKLFELSSHNIIGLTCTDCHMPPIGKSAEGSPLYRWGDVTSHLFRINITAEAATVPEGAKAANPYVDLGWACARPGCHGGTSLPFGASSYFVAFTSTEEIAKGVAAIHDEVEEKLETAKSLYNEVKQVYSEKAGSLTDETRKLVEKVLSEAEELISLVEEDETHGIHAPNYVPTALAKLIDSLSTVKAMMTIDPKWTTITQTVTQPPQTTTVEKTVTETITRTLKETETFTETIEKTLTQTMTTTATATTTETLTKPVTQTLTSTTTETVTTVDMTGYYVAGVLAIIAIILAGLLVRKK